jgi:DNA-binding response OmpR family regulator
VTHPGTPTAFLGNAATFSPPFESVKRLLSGKPLRRPKRPPPPPTRVRQVNRLNPRMLIVEDEAEVAQNLGSLFRYWFWETVIVLTRAEALAHVGDPLDLILLDILLPDGSGFEVLRAVRERGVKAPVALMSATTNILTREIVDLKPDEMFPKPLSMDRLKGYLDLLRARFYAARPHVEPPELP